MVKCEVTLDREERSFKTLNIIGLNRVTKSVPEVRKLGDLRTGKPMPGFSATGFRRDTAWNAAKYGCFRRDDQFFSDINDLLAEGSRVFQPSSARRTSISRVPLSRAGSQRTAAFVSPTPR